jgi:DNA-binding CsgD family transcriptional regulator/PAS domain-containing protein
VAAEIDLDQLLDLVDSIYDVALSPAGWDPLLERVTRALDGTAAIFSVQDARRSVGFARLWGLPEAALEQYGSRFAPLDLGLDLVLASSPGTVVTEESVPRDLSRRSPFVHEFRRPWGVERGIGYDVFRDGGRFAMLAVQAPKRRKPFGSAEATLLERIRPHLRRAVQLRTNLEQALAHRRALEDTLDGLAVGVVLMDEAGAVFFANAAARRIAERNDGLTIARTRLRAASDAANRALGKAIAEATDTATRAGLAAGATLAVPRPSGARPYAVLVGPGPGAASQSIYRSAAAIVMIGDPDARLEASERIVARLYGLTPGEARLAVAVASGEALDDYAAARGVSVSTVRQQMKQVLAKTGARRQADLVRLLLTGPAAARNPRE